MTTRFWQFFTQNLPLIMITGTMGSSFLSCAHHPDVRPSTSGIHSVITRGEEREETFRNARDQADDYCDDSDKKAYIVSEEIKFTGDGDEKDYRQKKKLAKAATVGGGLGSFFLPSKGARAAAGVVTVGGAAGNAYLGEEYRIWMKFKCKK